MKHPFHGLSVCRPNKNIRRHSTAFLFLTAILGLVSAPVFAQTDIESVGSFYDMPELYAREVLASHGNVFVQAWDRILAINSGSVDEFGVMGSWKLPGTQFIRASDIEWPYLYVMGEEYDPDSSTLYKLDVSDPARITVVGVRRLDLDHALYLHVYGSWLYVWSNDRVQVLSSEGSRFQFLNTIDYDLGANVQIKDHYMLKFSWNGYKVFDLTNPRVPVEIGHGSEPEGGKIVGDYLYFIDGHVLTAYYAGNLPEFEPQGSVVFDSYFGPVYSTVPMGDTLVFKSFPDEMYIDISSPGSPQLLGYSEVGGSAMEASAIPGHVIVFNHAATFARLIDITDITNPVEIANAKNTLGVSTTGFTLRDDLLVIEAGYNGCVLYDVSDPIHPQYLSTILSSRTNQVGFHEQYIYVQDSEGVLIHDISDPANPVHAGTLDIDNTQQALAVDNGILAISNSQVGPSGRIRYYDLTAPTAPDYIGYTQNCAHELFMADGILWAMRYGSWEGVFDIDVSTRQVISSFETQYPDIYHESDLRDSVLAVPAEHLGLSLMDTRFPDWLRLYSLYDDLPDSVYGVSLAGHYAALATTRGVRILDISDPRAPILAASWPGSQQFNIQMTESGVVYVSDDISILILNAAGALGLALSPENVNAELVDPDGGTVDLSWSAPAGDPPDLYQIERNGNLIAETTGLTWTDTLPGWGSYEYGVRAIYGDQASSAALASVDWLAPVGVDMTRIGFGIVSDVGGRVRADVHVASRLAVAETVRFELVIQPPEDAPVILQTWELDLDPGQIIQDRVRVDVPAAAPAGVYSLLLLAEQLDGESLGGDSVNFSKLQPPVGEDGPVVWYVDGLGAFTVANGRDKGPLPAEGTVVSIAPNPANPTSTVTLRLSISSDVEVTVYNTLGQRVMKVHHGALPAATHRFVMDGRNLASGLYFIVVRTDVAAPQVLKLMLLQ